MPFVPNLGVPAIAFIDACAILLILVLNVLLVEGFRERFFGYWIAGWAVFAAFGVERAAFEWRGGTFEHLLTKELSLAATILFLAAILEYRGISRQLPWFWAMGTFCVSAVALASWLGQPAFAGWLATEIESAVCLAAGWVLWRADPNHRGLGATLLAAALMLRGLHGVDRVEWQAQTFFLLRVSFSGLLDVAMGIAMAVLVLEADRARAEDLNDKLHRLTLIIASASQSFRVEELLGQVLYHLVDSLGASHGLVRLLDGQGEEASIVLRAAVGFSGKYLRQYARAPASEPWARKVLDQGIPFLVSAADRGEVPGWIRSEELSAFVLVRVPSKEGPLGLLGIGSKAPRVFEQDEVNFLVNVANLLGLTIQNVRLFEEVANAQRQWVFTFDSIGDLILAHDQDGRTLRVNRALADRLGCEAASLIGRPLRELLRRGEARWSQCPYCEGLGGKSDALDPTFGGYFLVTNSDFHDDAGRRLGTVHVLKDFTDRREAETKFRTLFETVQEGVFISTLEGRFIDFNDAFMRLLGYENRQELLNRDIGDSNYADPADWDRLKRLLSQHGEATNFEFQLRRRDGEIRHVTESSFATRDASGAIVSYQGFVLDVTERKQAEQEIRRRNKELMALNSLAQMLGQSLDLEEVLARVLRKVLDLFGVDLGAIYLLDEKTGAVKRAAAVGHRSDYARHFPPAVFPQQLLQHIREVRATLLSVTSLRLPEIFQDVLRQEGVQVAHLVVLWAKDRIVGGLAVSCRTMREFSAAELNLLAAIGSQIAATIDKSLLLDETRQAYDNLRRTQEQLLQSEKMAAVGQLISGVAHELNNPLTAILGYSQLLGSGEHTSPRGVEYVEKLYKQAQRTHRIVQNLLSFARQHKPERMPVQLNQILEDTLLLREYDLKVNNILIHREFDAKLPPTAADTHQLQQVFLNILNNAFDAVLESEERREIWIRTARVADRLEIEFTDSGRGVQDPHRVFDPFYTTKPVGKGTGLGLSICYGIVKEHGGEIRVRNSPPRGATFAIDLPMSAADQTRSDGPAKEEVPACGLVLLVDDEESVLELEQEILRGRCRGIRAVTSGCEALRILQEECVDVVVTDIKMPGEVCGHEIYRWIERYRPELGGRVIFTVSDPRDEAVRELLESSGCAFVHKPFAIDEFLNAVRRVLASAGSTTIKR
jgi:PAS domain S-box-containing protein